MEEMGNYIENKQKAQKATMANYQGKRMRNRIFLRIKNVGKMIVSFRNEK